VMTEGESSVKKIDEAIRSRAEGPFEELVVDTAKSRGGLVGCCGESRSDLFRGDRGKGSGGERVGILVLKWINLRVIGEKKPVFEGFCHFADVIRKSEGGNEEWGYAFD